MPSYCWRCDACQERTDVIRSMANYEQGPDDPCKCGSVKFTRVIPEWKPQQTQLIHGGSAPWYAETVIGKRHYPTGR